MRISLQRLIAEAEATGFRADVLEKAAQLLGLLNSIQSHPFLRGKFALKGGTALNLFVFDVPRLSVDIDLNYVGNESRDAMLEERPKIVDALQAVFSREDFVISWASLDEHAADKWSLRYLAASGQRGRVDVDVNYMYRVPLWPIAVMDSRPLGRWQATAVPVVDIHELAAGKLVALLDRHKARDLFDSRLILSMAALDNEMLRTAFVVYGAMARKDWRTTSAEDVALDSADLSSQLMPTLRTVSAQGHNAAGYGVTLVEQCRAGLGALLPFRDAEREFLDLLLDEGRIEARLLTPEPALQERIQAHPSLEWKAQHVRRHKGLP